MRGVARLDPFSIIIAGGLFGGLVLVLGYSRKYVKKRRKAPEPQHPIKVSDTRIYSRYGKIGGGLEEVDIVRDPHETPEEYARLEPRLLKAVESIETPETVNR